MIYKITGYYNTGFDGVNIPDTPQMLDLKFIETQGAAERYVFNRIDLPALDIRQSRFLSNVRVKATWQQVRDIDYIHVRSEAQDFLDFPAASGAGYYSNDPYMRASYPTYGGNYFGKEDSWYYIVTGITMVSDDVAQLSIVPDFITSIGGVRNLLITGGVTRRIKTTETLEGVEYFAQDDPFTAPSEPMTVYSMPTFNDSASSNQTYVESTVDLEAMGQSSTNDVVPLGHVTSFKADSSISTKETTRNTGIFYAGGGFVEAGIAKCRAIGAEGAIINSFSVSSVYVEPTTPVYDPINYLIGKKASRSLFSPLQPVTSPYDQYINKRVRYGSFLKVFIMSCTGDSFSCNPEECDLDNSGNINVTMVADPSPDGRPYYILATKTNPDSAAFGFLKMANSVPGMTWKQQPIVWYEKSGNVLEKQVFEAQQKIAGIGMDYAEAGYGQQQRQIAANARMSEASIDLQEAQIHTAYQQGTANRIFNFASGAAQSIATGILASGGAGAAAGSAAGPLGTAAGAGIGAAIGLGGTLLSGSGAVLGQIQATENQDLSMQGIANARAALSQSTAVQMDSAALGMAKTRAYYSAQRALDKMQFDFSQKCVVPTLAFPYKTDFLRDYIGNGILAFQFRYTSHDVVRIDKLLNAYGVVYTRLLKRSDLWGGPDVYTSGQGTNYYTPGTYDRNYYFSYVEADGVTVGGLPTWLAREVSEQLSGGVRVWHHLHHQEAYINENRVAIESRTAPDGETQIPFGFLFPGSPWYYESTHQNKVAGEVETYV